MVWISGLLELLNQKLEQDGIDWDLHIGHSHFMKDTLDERGLKLIWDYDVMPTLEEYFYKQHEKLKFYELDSLKAALEVNPDGQ